MSEESAKNTSIRNRTRAFDQETIYVLGPCSAESRDQVVNTAMDISKVYPEAVFRSGIWKPRTRPGSFEGIGESGLKWLKEASELSGLTSATEVANTKHVELALETGIDILWIGARTTVNPFYVQEIAESVKGVDIPIMIKNPLAPDYNLWLGAIERFEKSGINQIAAIHRGFHHFDSSPFRNLPQWEIVIELMAHRPDLPIICDISHIGGNPKLFPVIAQKAMDLNMSGLHIEVHPDPINALSDAKQQITFDELNELLSKIEWRRPSTDDPEFSEDLEKLRREIDHTDNELIQSFFNRMKTISKIGILKKEKQVTILQVERWKQIEEHYIREGKALGLSEGFLKNMLTALHDESMRIQHDIMNS